jgi:Secretion system C-terminal sorting domain
LNAQVYPNPFDKTLTLHFDNPNLITAFNVSILDPLGKMMMQKQISATSDIVLTEVALLPSGFYFLRIVDTENRQTVLKIVKQ